MCLGIASFFACKGGLSINKQLFYRDSFVYLLTLALIFFFLRDNKIEIYEALILVSLWPCYIYFSNMKFNSNIEIKENEQNNEMKSTNELDNETKPTNQLESSKIIRLK